MFAISFDMSISKLEEHTMEHLITGLITKLKKA